MARPRLIAVALIAVGVTAGVTALTGLGSAARLAISGSASCQIAVAGPGYQYSETHTWQVGGTETKRGAFTIVPSHWTVTGSGSSHQAQGNQSLDITMTTNATADGQFQFYHRAADDKVVAGQANSQLRVANGITGTQQQTVGGVSQPPKPFGLEAFEIQLPPMAAPAKSGGTIAGSTPATPVINGSIGPFKPGGSTTTIACTWNLRTDLVAAVPPPVRGRSVNVQTVSGTVLVNGSPLTAATSIRVGSVVDATRGTVRLTSANGAGDFHDGAFRISESRVSGPTDLRLRLGSIATCAKRKTSAVEKKKPPKELDSLWGNGNGSFRTTGRYASATVRGTFWRTVDRCDGTLVVVRRGVVDVLDLKRQTTKRITAGRQLLVPAP